MPRTDAVPDVKPLTPAVLERVICLVCDGYRIIDAGCRGEVMVCDKCSGKGYVLLAAAAVQEGRE